jgi:hypothetical protein
MASAPPGVQVVSDFHRLTATSLSAHVNALCWRRHLPGDFAEVVAALGDGQDSVLTLDGDMLQALPLSAAGRIAADSMLADFRLLSERHLAPVLNCVYGYQRDDRGGPIATDVFSFHVDSAPCPTDTWLCTYHGPSSEGLWHTDSQRLVDRADTRAALLSAYGGSDDAGFQEFLSDNAYDLHYAALPQARPYRFGVGHLWRIATQYPDSSVPPCIHRAPPHAPGDPPRLLLIS